MIPHLTEQISQGMGMVKKMTLEEIAFCEKHKVRYVKDWSCSRCKDDIERKTIREQRREERKLTESPIKRLEKAEVEIMEIQNIYEPYYEPKIITKNLWECLGCGLVWAMEHDARSCKSRDHKASYSKRYGGRVENGTWLGGREYEVSAIRREKIKEETIGA